MGGQQLGREDAISNRRALPKRCGASRIGRLRLPQLSHLRACALCGVATISGGLIPISPADAQQQSNTLRNTFGEVGVLEMPSAHMAPDGQLAFTVGEVAGTQHYNLSFQVFPGVESSFRYSRAARGFYDRSFALKVRLVRESSLLPDVSAGIRDFLGTGVYGSEYIVASKQIGDFDFTAGMGWGRLADNGTLPNPLGQVFSSFNTRASQSNTGGATGGLVDLGQFFHGPKVGLFGGIIWQTPIDNLRVMAEYSSDEYKYERTLSTGALFKVRSPVNVGLSYAVSDSLSLTGGWFYGSTYGFTVALSGDPNTEAPTAIRMGPKVPPAIVRNDTEQQQSLSLMIDRNNQVAAINTGGPWVRVPTEDQRAKQDLRQALLSEARSVRDIDIEGTTLVIDAHNQDSAQTQCARYAEIASAVGSRVTSIAMTDLQSAAGTVVFCPVANRATYAQSGATGGLPLDGTAPKAGELAALESKIRADMDNQSIYLDTLSLGPSEMWVYYENGRYRREGEAAGRLARVLMADAPQSIEFFHLIPTVLGLPAQEITIARSTLERATLAHATAAELGDAVTLSAPPLDNPVLDRAQKSIYPVFYWTLDPKLTEHVFDPDAPLQFMVYADATAGLILAPGLTLSTELTANIWNDYSLTRGAGSLLPHVRTDLLQYIKYGQNGIAALEVNYRMRLARDVIGEVKAGYLEDMFMGAGGQVLWRPENSRFSFGVDLYQVWKRDFDRLFGVQDYHILTGHASIYYRSPWHDINFNVHVGRYLAGDYGATFEVTRQFSTGVEVGAFATFTNVPFSRFGEGSFDKGIIVHIPFEWSLPIFSQSAYNLHLNALTRDGGQRLGGDDSLYQDTRRTSYGEVAEHFDDFVEP